MMKMMMMIFKNYAHDVHMFSTLIQIIKIKLHNCIN